MRFASSQHAARRILKSPLRKPGLARRAIEGYQRPLALRAQSVRTSHIGIVNPEEPNLLTTIDRVGDVCADQPDALSTVLRTVCGSRHAARLRRSVPSSQGPPSFLAGQIRSDPHLPRSHRVTRRERTGMEQEPGGKRREGALPSRNNSGGGGNRTLVRKPSFCQRYVRSRCFMGSPRPSPTPSAGTGPG